MKLLKKELGGEWWGELRTGADASVKKEVADQVYNRVYWQVSRQVKHQAEGEMK